MGTGVYRTKGFLWLAPRPAEVLLWQQSGSQITFDLTSFWAASTLTDDLLLQDENDFVQKRVESIHPIFGDRRNALTVIGLPDACKVFAAALKSALCTEDEIADWQRGDVFADPWPKRVRRVV